jgi:hypothetical protein
MIGLVVIVAVLIGGFAWFVTKRNEQLAQEAEMAAQLLELQAAQPFVADATFELQLAKSHPLLPGLSLIKISADGTVERDYRVEDIRWRRLKFQIDNRSLNELVESINTLGIMNLANEYFTPVDTDGTVEYVLIKCGGRVKLIACANQTPEQIEKLWSYVGKLTNKANENGLKGVPIDWKDHREREKELFAHFK